MPNIISKDNLEDKEIRYRLPSANDTVEDIWKPKHIVNM